MARALRMKHVASLQQDNSNGERRGEEGKGGKEKNRRPIVCCGLNTYRRVVLGLLTPVRRSFRFKCRETKSTSDMAMVHEKQIARIYITVMKNVVLIFDSSLMTFSIQQRALPQQQRCNLISRGGVGALILYSIYRVVGSNELIEMFGEKEYHISPNENASQKDGHVRN